MQYVRFKAKGKKPAYGILKGNSIRRIKGDIFGDYQKTDRKYKLSEVKLLAPVVPGKILAMGLNYQSHIGNRPPPSYGFFIKTPTSIQDPEADIIVPKVSNGRVEPEGELVVVIGKQGKHIPAEQAAEYILGYTCGNDVSERDWQQGNPQGDKDLQWARAKSSDTFSPVGPAIVTDIDPRNVMLRTRVNGKIVQEQTTGDLILDVYKLVAQVSETMTLEPGDLIFTGTPGQPQPVQPGDVVEVEIEGIGVLRNYVKKEE